MENPSRQPPIPCRFILPNPLARLPPNPVGTSTCPSQPPPLPLLRCSALLYLLLLLLLLLLLAFVLSVEPPPVARFSCSLVFLTEHVLGASSQH